MGLKVFDVGYAVTCMLVRKLSVFHGLLVGGLLAGEVFLVLGGIYCFFLFVKLDCLCSFCCFLRFARYCCLGVVDLEKNC